MVLFEREDEEKAFRGEQAVAKLLFLAFRRRCGQTTTEEEVRIYMGKIMKTKNPLKQIQ